MTTRHPYLSLAFVLLVYSTMDAGLDLIARLP